MRYSRIVFMFIFMIVVTGLGLVSPIPQVHADDYVVNDLGDDVDEDTGDGICEATDGTGDCTLRAAIDQINADENDSTITFDPALNGSTIQLTNGGLPTIAVNQVNGSTVIVAIHGPGAANLTIDGLGTPDRILHIKDGAGATASTPVTISGLTVKGGAGILVDDQSNTLILKNVVVTENTTGVGDGGGVSCTNGSKLIISGSTISNNRTDGAGGGVYSSSKATIAGSTISHNMSGDVGGGVAVLSGGMEIIDTTISENTTASSGGGIYCLGLMTIEGSTIVLNTSEADLGGGGILLAGGGTLDLNNSSLSNNQASGSSGGGLGIGPGVEAIINNSTIAGNETVGFGGGIRIFGAGTCADITNTTVSGNMANEDGGGIFLSSTTDNSCGLAGGFALNLLNVTITENGADTDNDTSGDGGGLATVTASGGTVFMANTIVANNTDPNSAPDCFTPGAAAIDSLGHNLIGTDEGCDNNDFDEFMGDIFGSMGSEIDALLEALTPADGGDPANGIPTGVHIPATTSPAVDAGNDLLAPPTDQLGETRAAGSASDIGAVEAPQCGDLVVTLPEQCDDGNTVDGDGCSAECLSDETCGNGIIDTASGEECDDGNTVDSDGCSSTCQTEGDGGGCSLVPTSSTSPWAAFAIFLAAMAVLGVKHRHERTPG